MVSQFLCDNREKNLKVFSCIPSRNVANSHCFRFFADEIQLEIESCAMISGRFMHGEDVWS